MINDIEHINFSKSSPEINEALIKLQAVSNIVGIPKDVYDDLSLKLLDSPQQSQAAMEHIEDLECKLIYPFCKQYFEEIIKLKEKYQQGNPFHWKRLLRAINRRNSEDMVFQLKNNAVFDASYVQNIKNTSQSNPSSRILIEIANTSGLNNNVVKMLKNCPNVSFCYLGKHPYQTHNLEEYLSPKSLSECLTKIESIEKNINSKWSDTAKALYVFRHMYQSCKYGPSVSMSAVFLQNNSVCQGFAVAYKDIMDRLGIESRICLSEEGDHVFNEIKLNNKWVPVDVSDATDLHKNVKVSTDVIERINFTGKRFVAYLPENYQGHHRSRGRYMTPKNNELNYLTKEEYLSAATEIAKKNNFTMLVQAKFLKTIEQK